MKRCYDPKAESYCYYGARGIVVCGRWHDPWIFFSDVGDKPTRHHSLDRRDVNGNYSPENCKWSTPYEQGQNKRRYHNQVSLEDEEAICRRYLEGGITQKAIGEEYGITGTTVCRMLKQLR